MVGVFAALPALEVLKRKTPMEAQKDIGNQLVPHCLKKHNQAIFSCFQLKPLHYHGTKDAPLLDAPSVGMCCWYLQ